MIDLRVSRLIKPFVRWHPRRDGKPGLEPNWMYEVWARIFTWEIRKGMPWKQRLASPSAKTLSAHGMDLGDDC